MQGGGDTHNFGHKVHAVDGGFLCKPRPTALEFLFLDPRSPLRQFFEEQARFLSLPTVDVEPEFEHFHRAYVRKIELPKLLRSLEASEWAQLGEITGLATWFGIRDLHFENMAIGHEEKFIAGPIDIESVFFRQKTPSQTLLLPGQYLHTQLSGWSSVLLGTEWAWPQALPPFLQAYAAAIEFLDQHSVAIKEFLRDFFHKKPCISRVVIRPSYEYEKFFSHRLRSNFTACELTQLERGDIPYYFRFLDSSDLLYFTEPCHSARASEQATTLIPADSFLIAEQDSFPVQDKNVLLNNGSLFISKLFLLLDKKTQIQDYEKDNFSIARKSGQLILRMRGVYAACPI